MSGDPDPTTIKIAPDLWRRSIEVSVEPPRADQPLRTFGTHADAIAHAFTLAAMRGWQVRDEVAADPT